MLNRLKVAFESPGRSLYRQIKEGVEDIVRTDFGNMSEIARNVAILNAAVEDKLTC